LKTLLLFGNFAGWQVEKGEYLFEICVLWKYDASSIRMNLNASTRVASAIAHRIKGWTGTNRPFEWCKTSGTRQTIETKWTNETEWTSRIESTGRTRQTGLTYITPFWGIEFYSRCRLD
jgi:hypothetical protein